MLGDSEPPCLPPPPGAPQGGRAPCSQQAWCVLRGDGGTRGSLGRCQQGTGSRFGRRRRRKAPDCQAAVQLVETAPIAVCITKHGSAGSGDAWLHPVAHGWKWHSQRSTGWRDRGVCLLQCRACHACHACAARGSKAEGCLVHLQQRWEGAKAALPAGSACVARAVSLQGSPTSAAPSTAAGLAALSPCRTHRSPLQGDIGGSAQGHLATLPHGSP